LVTSVPLYFLAEPIIVFFYTEEYAMAGHLLGLFAIRMLFTNMGVAKTSYITNEGLFKYSLICAVVGAGLNIGINYLLIPDYKSIGAIWATIISFTVSIFIVDLFYKGARHNFALMMKGIGTFWKFHQAR
jgi:O-antigen/teichoic acid export membrane protein